MDRLHLLIGLAAAIGCGSSAGYAGDPGGGAAITAGFQPHVEPCSGGSIDWTNGHILAIGKGIAGGTDDQDQLMAQRAATLDSAANALALSLGIPLGPSGRAGDVRNGRVLIEGVVKGHETVKVEWVPNASPPQCRVTLRVPLWGIKGVASVFAEEQWRSARRSAASRLPLVVEDADVSESVLVIDARGLDVRACLFPVVTDEGGAVLYDIGRLDAQAARYHPAVRYVESDRKLEELLTPVSADAPLARLATFVTQGNAETPTTHPATQPSEPRRRRRVVVKAAESAAIDTQIVLTKEDAETLRKSQEGASLLRSGRVVVVVDSAAAGIEGRRVLPDPDHFAAR